MRAQAERRARQSSMDPNAAPRPTSPPAQRASLGDVAALATAAHLSGNRIIGSSIGVSNRARKSTKRVRRLHKNVQKAGDDDGGDDDDDEKKCIVMPDSNFRMPTARRLLPCA